MRRTSQSSRHDPDGLLVVQLTGGLGNQLFQYALGRQLSVDRRVPLKLDISKYAYDSLRTYKLDCFNIQAGIATPDDIIRAKGGAGLRGKLRRRLDRLKPYYRRHWIKEQGSCFNAHILQAPRNAHLQGYWQSEKYFEGIAEILRDEFTLRQEASHPSRTLVAEMEQTNSVSLHVRRGDYVSNPSTSRMYDICGKEYYQLAMQAIAARVHEPSFFIFSDDIDWVRQNLPIGYPTVYVEHNGPTHDYEDLWLMSKCKHHIIANSSFSWWGAWLGDYKNKIIIAPKKWTAKSNWCDSDILPPDWTTL